MDRKLRRNSSKQRCEMMDVVENQRFPRRIQTSRRNNNGYWARRGIQTYLNVLYFNDLESGVLFRDMEPIEKLVIQNLDQPISIIVHYVRKLRRLTNLTIYLPDKDNNEITELGKLTHLKSLTIKGIVYGGDLGKLEKLKHLQYLFLESVVIYGGYSLRINNEKLRIITFWKTKFETSLKIPFIIKGNPIVQIIQRTYEDESENLINRYPDLFQKNPHITHLVLNVPNFANMIIERKGTIKHYFEYLDSIRYLTLRKGTLTHLIEPLRNLKNLTYLTIEETGFSSLTGDICEMENLQVLDIAHNNLTLVSKTVWDHPKLKKVDISYNPISDIKIEALVKNGKVKVIAHECLFLSPFYVKMYPLLKTKK